MILEIKFRITRMLPELEEGPNSYVPPAGSVERVLRYEQHIASVF